jgi:hypothetical protein
MVRKYEKMGYYNLAKPEFISEVITTFTNLSESSGCFILSASIFLCALVVWCLAILEDGATVRIYYESRLAKVSLSKEGKQLVEKLDDISYNHQFKRIIRMFHSICQHFPLCFGGVVFRKHRYQHPRCFW